MTPQRSHSRMSALWFGMAVPAFALVTTGASTCGNNTEQVPMRDGVTLATDVYAPAGRGTSPAVVLRTPYGRDGLSSYGPYFNDLGYTLVAQDMRGFGDSGGLFMMFTDDGWGSNQDGYDTIEWAASQDWSNGDTCLWGGSALAISSLLGAGSAPPHLKCVYALVGSGDMYHHIGFWGGALRTEMVVNWLEGLGQEASLQALYDHPSYDSFYEPVSIQERYDQVKVPIYSVGGWFDIFSQGNLDIFTGVDTGGGPGGRGTQKLMIGPWSHQSAGPTVGELTFPDNSVLPSGEDLRWLNHWLQGEDNGVDTEPPVSYYLMGDVDTPSVTWNIWKYAETWPVQSTSTPLYLLSGGGLSFSAPGLGSADGSRFTFDPADPVPTVGGNNLYEVAGPYDQRSVESRPDVLVFTSGVLDAPVAITGRVTATLWVSSSALDTDFTVKLTDVYPDGRSMLILDGIQRMRFRDGVEQEVLMTPGEIYQIEVDLWSTAQVFNAGHQIRVDISSSNAPRFDVNSNTGGSLYQDDTELVIADQVIYHDNDHPSHVNLPVVQ